jgi:hypothetical protein
MITGIDFHPMTAPGAAPLALISSSPKAVASTPTLLNNFIASSLLYLFFADFSSLVVRFLLPSKTSYFKHS